MDLEQRVDEAIASWGARYRLAFLRSGSPDEDGERAARQAVKELIVQWRDRAQEKAEGEAVEVAASFQRPLTKRGTGLPRDFLLALTKDHVLVFDFDPRSASRARRGTTGLGVASSQIKALVARWERDAVRIVEVDPGRLNVHVTFDIPNDGAREPVRCRMGLCMPQAAVLIAELGGSLPTS
jgi:hypothetical protein